jgi:hypothetical protein
VHPYRDSGFPTWHENELWLRLDQAMERAIRYPVWAYSIAWDVYMDAGDRFADVRRSACDFMATLMTGSVAA